MTFYFMRKYKIPPPDFCFFCRTQNRLAFWPFGKFHNRQCDLTGEKIISIFPSSARFPVYKNKNWYSDKWEPPFLNYNSSAPFFNQFYELQKKTPHPHQFGRENLNCDYSDDVWKCKNCYLCRSLAECENLSYCYRVIRCRDSYDLLYCYDTEQSYDCVYCFKNQNIKYAFNVRDSFDSAFLYDCRDVSNCFMCWNLRHKKYHILNKPYTKEEYFRKLEQYNLGSWDETQRLSKEFQERIENDAIHKTDFNIKTIRSTGNYLTECKNCQECYFMETSEDCAYMVRGLDNKDCYDGNGIFRGELIYDVCQLTDGFNIKHSNFCTNCREAEYLDFCVDCQYCFGCVGLKKKKYCILNKQYNEEEYFELVEKIRRKMINDGEYGKFFPYKMAYTGYNLSLAGIVFPKTEEQVKKLGGLWEDLENPVSAGVPIYKEVDDIKDVDDDVVNKALICRETGRMFNITGDELAFLRRHSIPLPRYYPDIRTIKRARRLFKMYKDKSNCYFCSKDIDIHNSELFNYKKIVCGDCYLKEVV